MDPLAAARRRVSTARARSLSDDFAFQWLHLSKLEEIKPDRTQFPQASGLLDPFVGPGQQSAPVSAHSWVANTPSPALSVKVPQPLEHAACGITCAPIR